MVHRGDSFGEAGWFGHLQFTEGLPQFQDAGIKVIGTESRFGQKARGFRRNSCTAATAPPRTRLLEAGRAGSARMERPPIIAEGNRLTPSRRHPLVLA